MMLVKVLKMICLIPLAMLAFGLLVVLDLISDIKEGRIKRRLDLL